ncbi:MAG: VWA domain-containing protein [Acidobacteriota bacterium]
MLIPNKVAVRFLYLIPVILTLLVLRVLGESPEPPGGKGQTAGDQAPTVTASTAPIRVSSNLVLVPVSVTDSNQKPVKNLSIEDFRVTEDGLPQTIANMQEPGQSPVELALLIDISGSVMPRFRFEQEAGSQFVRSVAGLQQFVTLFTVGPEARIVSQRTNDAAAAVSALMSLTPTREATAFYDTLVSAARYLRQTASPFSRRVQVAISDGEDNYSQAHGLDSALRELQQADCLFYSINPAAASIRMNIISRRGQEALQFLANQTGGSAYLPDDWSELPSIYRLIAGDLQAQYLLGYYSSRGETRGEEFRRITVSVPGRHDLRVRARQGYYAAG